MMTDSVTDEALARAVQWLREADGLLLTAGAGMGGDSGLPDFRGADGFWRAYPALHAKRTHFEEIANPAAFLHDPVRAWASVAIASTSMRNASGPSASDMLASTEETDIAGRCPVTVFERVFRP